MTGVQTRLDLSMVATPRSMHVTPRDMVATPRSMHVTPRDMVATPRSMQVTPRDMVSTSRVPSASVERQREHQGSLYTDLPQPVPRSPVRMPVLQDPLRNAMASTLATDGSKFPELMHPALRKREKLLMISPSKPRSVSPLLLNSSQSRVLICLLSFSSACTFCRLRKRASPPCMLVREATRAMCARPASGVLVHTVCDFSRRGDGSDADDRCRLCRDLDMLSTPWASGQKSKMTWSVPMRSMTGRTAPGPVIVRT
jgi:hypothetical protein